MSSFAPRVFLALALAAACSKQSAAPGSSAGQPPSIASAIAAAATGAEPTQAGVTPAAPTRGATPPTTDFVTVRDPVEDAYSIGMPKGWQNRTYSARVQDVHSMVATSLSPDGSVLLFSGDPNIPQYWNPRTASPAQRYMARENPRVKLEAFERASTYFPRYVKRKFGALPGFTMGEVAEDIAAQTRLAQEFAKAGVTMTPTVATVAFSYTEGGKTMRSLVIGSTSDSGAFWVVTVSGITTTGDPKVYVPMLEAMGRTHRMNPAWQAEQNRKHQARMAQLQAFGRQQTARHQRNMAWIQRSAARHQKRMQAIHAQGDASMKRFDARMKAGDAQHRGFLNYINEEHTVVDAKGKAYQVDNSYQRYFVNKRTGTYVGGDIRMDVDKLRGLKLNPDDYEEVKIKR